MIDVWVEDDELMCPFGPVGDAPMVWDGELVAPPIILVNRDLTGERQADGLEVSRIQVQGREFLFVAHEFEMAQYEVVRADLRWRDGYGNPMDHVHLAVLVWDDSGIAA